LGDLTALAHHFLYIYNKKIGLINERKYTMGRILYSGVDIGPTLLAGRIENICGRCRKVMGKEHTVFLQCIIYKKFFEWKTTGEEPVALSLFTDCGCHRDTLILALMPKISKRDRPVDKPAAGQEASYKYVSFG
jgi:hypothetical protein